MSDSKRVNNTQDNANRNRRGVSGLWLYFIIYVIESLYSIFIRYSDFSFNIELNMLQSSNIVMQLIRLLSYSTARFMLWIGVYGIIATFFKDKIGDFHKYFTVVSVILFTLSLIFLFWGK